jgi:hypothetical protein
MVEEIVEVQRRASDLAPLSFRHPDGRNVNARSLKDTTSHVITTLAYALCVSTIYRAFSASVSHPLSAIRSYRISIQNPFSRLSSIIALWSCYILLGPQVVFSRANHG